MYKFYHLHETSVAAASSKTRSKSVLDNDILHLRSAELETTIIRAICVFITMKFTIVRRNLRENSEPFSSLIALAPTKGVNQITPTKLALLAFLCVCFTCSSVGN